MEFRTRKKSKGNSESPLKRDSKKFLIGTKVLCYEPDKSKQKILYDAKVSFFLKIKLFYQQNKLFSYFPSKFHDYRSFKKDSSSVFLDLNAKKINFIIIIHNYAIYFAGLLDLNIYWILQLLFNFSDHGCL